ncbi:MAG: hypothetical protein OXE78_11265 [Gammaproteobacteria bacterium]|nr:hypothetical protein [Gammaproteobacteria bacterium]
MPDLAIPQQKTALLPKGIKYCKVLSFYANLSPLNVLIAIFAIEAAVLEIRDRVNLKLVEWEIIQSIEEI